VSTTGINKGLTDPRQAPHLTKYLARNGSEMTKFSAIWAKPFFPWQCASCMWLVL